MNTAMPIGRDDFADLRRGGYYFVDKSEHIARLIDHPAEVTLFTRPRRFGKTMLLSMLRYFLDIEGAEEHRKLFDGLKIAENPEAMAQQGSRPVLFLSLKEWKADSWDEMQQVIFDALGQIFDKRKSLSDIAHATEREQMIFQKIRMETASLVTCRSALSLLLQLLEKYYGKKPVLLLDEYDVPIQQSWEHGYYEKAIGFFREFLSAALKSNPSLDFAILTGVLRISKESIFSDLNNLKVDSVLQTQYSEAFGFTTTEVEKLANDLGWADKLVELRDWYDGYRFAGQEIYNPWSVLNYFDQGCKPATYWANTSGNVVLGELLRYTDTDHVSMLEGLLNGDKVQANLREGVIYSDIYGDQVALYTMLCMTGYLTIAATHWDGMRRTYDLCLPNREMLLLFTDEIMNRFQRSIGPNALKTFMQALLDGRGECVQDILSRYLEIVTSTFDTAKGKESFYHGLVLGMTALLVPDYEVRSNRESGRGRYDVAVFPKRAGDPGLLIEFKTAEKEDQLEAKAQEALRQIEERGYEAELKGRGIACVRRYGIAFCGKTVRVKLGA